MESHSESQPDPASAREALDAIGNDRLRVGDRMTAETWWAAPAQGAGVALLVAGPAVGFQWAWLLLVAGMWVFVGVELIFRRRSGLTVSRPAGPRGLAILIALAILIVGALAVSVTLSILSLNVWILVVAAVAGIVAMFGVMAYDRTYAAEVRRAR